LHKGQVGVIVRIYKVNEKHWGFKPVFRCSKPHTLSTFSGEEKKCPFTLFNKATKELNKTTIKSKNTKSRIKKG